jgi:hypothetical protein
VEEVVTVLDPLTAITTVELAPTEFINVFPETALFANT